MERRTFVKSAGLLAGASLLNTANVFAEGDAAGIIKIGVIGCGDRGKGIIQVINQLPDKFKVIAVCDVLDFRLTEPNSKIKTQTLLLIKIIAVCWIIKMWMPL